MKGKLNSDEVEKLKHRNLWSFFFLGISHGLAIGIFNVVYQPFLLELTDSILITGIFVTIGAVMIFFPLPLVGKLSDRFGRKKLMLLSLPLCILGLVSLIFSNPSNLHLLVIGILLFFFGKSMDDINSLVLISESSDKSKGLMLGLMLFTYFGGNIVGSYIVFLGQELETRFFFQVIIGIFIIEWFVYIICISDKIQKKNNREIFLTETSDSKQNAWQKIFQTPKTKGILIFFVADIFIYSISMSIYSGGLMDYYLFTREDLALLSVMFNISVVVSQIPAGHIVDKIGKKNSLVLCEMLGLGSFFLKILAFFLWFNQFDILLFPTILISEVLWGFNVSTFNPSMVITQTDLDETSKAESYGIVEFIKGIGFMPTGIIGGFLIEKVHYIAPFIITSIGIIFEIWFLLKYFRD